MTSTHDTNGLMFAIAVEDGATVVSLLKEDQISAFGDTYLFDPSTKAVDFIKECVNRNIIGKGLRAATLLSALTGNNQFLRDIAEYLAPRMTRQTWERTKVKARNAFVAYDRLIPFHDNNASVQGA